jgi:hypothetical protein
MSYSTPRTNTTTYPCTLSSTTTTAVTSLSDSTTTTSTTNSTTLDDVFEFLHCAEQIQVENPIEAATKV